MLNGEGLEVFFIFPFSFYIYIINYVATLNQVFFKTFFKKFVANNSYPIQHQLLMVRCPPNYPLVAGAGFEPTTFGLWAQRATRLLHPAILYFFLLFLSFIYILYNTLEEKCKYFWLFYVEKLYFGYCQAHFLFFFSLFLIYNIIINPKARKIQVF